MRLTTGVILVFASFAMAVAMASKPHVALMFAIIGVITFFVTIRKL